MFLGDSFIMGPEINKEDCVSEQVERADSMLDCYNFGITGYGTDQELLVLEKFGSVVKPEYVLLFFCINDFFTNHRDWAHDMSKPFFELHPDGFLELKNVPVPRRSFSDSLIRWFKNRLALGQLAQKAAFPILHRDLIKPASPQLERKRIPNPEMADSLSLAYTTVSPDSLTQRLLLEISDRCQNLQAQLIVFLIPSSREWTVSHRDTPERMREVGSWCSQEGVACIDLFPDFYDDYARYGQNLFIHDRCHWNARGGAIAAGEVLKAIKRKSHEKSSLDH